VLLPFLDREHERQIKEGVISLDEEEDLAYPFSGN
jgi:hypothetical protein